MHFHAASGPGARCPEKHAPTWICTICGRTPTHHHNLTPNSRRWGAPTIFLPALRGVPNFGRFSKSVLGKGPRRARLSVHILPQDRHACDLTPVLGVNACGALHDVFGQWLVGAAKHSFDGAKRATSRPCQCRANHAPRHPCQAARLGSQLAHTALLGTAPAGGISVSLGVSNPPR